MPAASVPIFPVGFPGSADAYQVNVELPADLPSGPAELKLSVAWIDAPPVRIPSR